MTPGAGRSSTQRAGKCGVERPWFFAPDAMWRAWTGQADAWFLDGFSPALNPQMWRDDVLEAVAARTAPGGRLATFTVAGSVRRALEAQGFVVAKRPGHGRKRERLEAWRADDPAPSPVDPPRVAVIGAGIAGAAMARALRSGGAEIRVFDPAGPGQGASGNPAALVTPRLDAGLGPLAALFAQALGRARRLYSEVAGAVLSQGVLQLARQSRDEARFARIAESDLFEPGDMSVAKSEAAQQWTGEAAGSGHDAGGWALLDPEGREMWRGEAVVLCAGCDVARLVPEIQLQPVRGQVSIAPGLEARAVAWGGYVAPSPEGLVFGATHDRDETGTEVRLTDHQRNLATLAEALPDLAQGVSLASLSGRASVRAVTPDRLPVAGMVPGRPGGLHVLTGLGSRGFCLAPLLAEHVAAQILGAASPLPVDLSALVDPDRFRRRAERRTGRTPE
ncbi:MAG: hypothetical protein B7Z13_14335 [Caulobacterales bacterium 32-67-6]|nr:MAG: hypothetical protein B7Z13_14335 [Caulobacterales bacterium 32-67-6]